MSIEGVSAVRPAPPVREAAKAAPPPPPAATQGADVVKLSAKAQEAFAAAQKGADADHDGD